MTNGKCYGSGGARTHNPRLKRPLPYRLGHRPVTNHLRRYSAVFHRRGRHIGLHLRWNILIIFAHLLNTLMPEAGIEPARINIGFTDRRPSIGHLRPRYSPLKNQKSSNFTLLAEAARSAQIPLLTCLLEFRERENRSRKVIDAG
jgi:hypothetical protein